MNAEPLESMHRLAGELLEAGRLEDAERVYREVAAADPGWAAPLYNLGLVYKRMCRWEDSARYSRLAAGLDPDDAAAWWNLGIAATALEPWAEARTAWRQCGIAIPDGEGPPRMAFGPIPVRLFANGEVVWCDRIDPARAIVRNVPMAESGRHAGDLLLHDGQPDGYRIRNGVRVPVFNEIQRLRESGASTYVAELRATTAADGAAVLQLFADHGLAAEDWTASVGILCELCDRGVPHSSREHRSRAPWRPERRVAISSADPGPVHRLLAEWEKAGAGRTVDAVSCVLPASGVEAP
jgi:hypothetical protein